MTRLEENVSVGLVCEVFT